MNKWFLLGAAIVAVAVGVWVGYSTQGGDTGTKPPVIQGAIFDTPRALKNVQLMEADGTPLTAQDLKGYWNLIFVGYTNCPDVCPNTLNVLDQVYGLMEEQGLAPPRVVFISIDPERDKPGMIRDYVEYFNENFIGVTGDTDNLDTLARQMSVVYAKAPGVDGSMSKDNYLMDHSSSLILLNPDAEVQAILTAPHTPMNVIDSIVRTQVYYYE